MLAVNTTWCLLPPALILLHSSVDNIRWWNRNEQMNKKKHAWNTWRYSKAQHLNISTFVDRKWEKLVMLKRDWSVKLKQLLEKKRWATTVSKIKIKGEREGESKNKSNRWSIFEIFVMIQASSEKLRAFSIWSYLSCETNMIKCLHIWSCISSLEWKCYGIA